MKDRVDQKYCSSYDIMIEENTRGLLNDTVFKDFYSPNFYIALFLAISSSLFIGSSFIFKKISLIRLNQLGSIRAGAGGFGYLKDWIWWLGIAAMGLGELLNFAAYTFAPASLITPLGALSVLVSAILASRFLGEKLNILGKMGCVLCILGSTIMVIHSPKQEQIRDLQQLLRKLQEPAYVNYILAVLTMSFTILFYIGPRYGSRYVSVYIALCSAIGSITVIMCKTLGLAIKTYSFGSSEEQPSVWLLFTLFMIIAICICVQINYLNKALDLFSAIIVTPIYYVFFTTLVVMESAVLLNEWDKMSIGDILGGLCGFFVTIVAVFILNVFKENTSLAYFRQTTKYDSIT